ncbi:MAG: hypothetical protein ACLFVU_11515 [Phycisphaerae bacterium]
MTEINEFYWAFLVVAAVLYVIATFRMALAAKRHGRSPVLWFFISLFFTALPATYVFHKDHVRQLKEFRESQAKKFAEFAPKTMPPAGSDGELRVCPHCGQHFSASEIDRSNPRCPHCKLCLADNMDLA